MRTHAQACILSSKFTTMVKVLISSKCSEDLNIGLVWHFIDHYSIDDLKNGLAIRSHNLNTSPLFRSYCIGKYKLMHPITGIVKGWLLDVSGYQVSSIQVILHLSLSCRSCSTDAFHYWISNILVIGCSVFRYKNHVVSYQS